MINFHFIRKEVRFMKHSLFALGLLLGSDLAAGPMDFEASAREWITPDPGMTIAGRNGSLQLHFQANDFTPTQHGNWLYNRKVFRLLLKQPQMLQKDCMRIVFEASGHEYKTWNTRDEVIQIWPVIRDESGELLSYIPQKYPHLYPGGTRWATWMTAPFFAGEAGGATQDIYTAENGDRNAWPDGKLEFLGFKIVVHTRNPQKKKTGSVQIGRIMESGERLPVGVPYFHADSICRTKGTFHFAGTIARGFQASPVVEFSRKISFDPADPASQRQRIELPIPPGNGEFWCEWMFSDENGKRIAGSSFRHQTTHAEFNCTAKPAQTNAPPALGYLRINPHREAVYERNETPELRFTVWPDGKKSLKIRTELLSYQYEDLFETKEFHAQFSSQAPQTFSYTPTLRPDRDAYRCRFTVKDSDGTIMQIREYVFGRRSDLKQARQSRTGLPVDRHALKDLSYNRATFHILWADRKNIKKEKDLTDRFLHAIRSAAPLTRYWTYTIDPAEMEILPGVFDFAVLDQIMDLAADSGVALTLRVTHIESEKPYRWLPYSAQHNFDGLPIFEHYYGGYSLGDRNYLEVWHRLNRALFDRYGNHPAFQGYYLLQPAGEFTIEDKPWEGIVAGYEPPMKQAFQDYLKHNLKLDLPALNRRWNTRFKSWEEVSVPQPAFRLGKMPDLSMRWNDFSKFKFYLDTEGFFPEAVRRIRSYTDRHVIILYSAPQNNLSGAVDYFHNGGNAYLQNEGRYVEAWEKGRTGWISEPHDPTRWASSDDSEWNLDWTVYMAILQAGGGGANLHVYNYPRKRTIENHGFIYAYDRLRKYMPVLDELNGFVSAQEPARIGIFQDPMTIACKHRTTFKPRMDDLARFFELVKFSKLPFATAEKRNLSQLRLLVLNPLDEVMSQENIHLIAEWIRNGGKAVMTANTGKYSPEAGASAPWPLLRALGIAAPDSAYRTTGRNVTASVLRENPFFDKEKGIRFYTGTEFKRDLQSKEIKEQFWKFPYRWIPETDYFGYYPGHHPNGEVIAAFPDGGAALSVHRSGKGEVLVFWGCPDYRPERMEGFIERAARWAGIQNPYQGNPIVFMQEGKSSVSDRRYVLLYQDQPGSYRQKMLSIPDGEYFAEELISDRKLGKIRGETLRTKGILLDFPKGASPLQILRFTPMEQYKTKWSLNYPELN